MPYIGTSPSNGVRRVHTYTATQGQTTFTGASNEGVTLSYVDTNYIDVYQNGVLLGTADYTSTSGTSVVLAQGASVSDIIVITVYDVFSVADTVSKTSGGSFDEHVTLASNKELRFVDTNESIKSDGSKLILKSGGTTFNFPTSDGSANQLIKTDGSGTLSFATDSGGGVLQVKHMNYDTEQSTTSTSYVASSITLNITPTLSSSKILAIFSVPLYGSSAGVATATLYRDSTDLAVNTSNNNYGFGYVNNNIPGNISGSVLDSPSSTSQLTYAIYHKRSSASNSYTCINTCTASLTLIEIASGVL